MEKQFPFKFVKAAAMTDSVLHCLCLIVIVSTLYALLWSISVRTKAESFYLYQKLPGSKLDSLNKKLRAELEQAQYRRSSVPRKREQC